MSRKIINRTLQAITLAISVAGVSTLSADEDYVASIDRLIASEQYEAARAKLSEARARNIENEDLALLERQLALLESIEQPVGAYGGGQLRASQMVDQLRSAVESGELARVKTVSATNGPTEALLSELYNQYAGVRVKVSYPLPDPLTGGFSSTLEILELETRDGDRAYPAPSWSSHKLSIEKSLDENLQLKW